MLKKILKIYQNFLDERLGNGTGIVALIAFMIFAVTIAQPNSQVGYSKTNILEIQSTTINSQKNIIIIDGKKYSVKIEEIKEMK